MRKPVVRYQDQQGPRGWDLIARKQLQIGLQVFPRGSTLPIDELKSDAIARLLNTKCVEWRKPDGVKGPQPRKIEVAPPEKPRPPVQLVVDHDPVEAWRLTLAANTRAFDGNKALAMDALMADVRARNLYMQASREAGRSL
jgi:hypothetical protein